MHKNVANVRTFCFRGVFLGGRSHDNILQSKMQSNVYRKISETKKRTKVFAVA